VAKPRVMAARWLGRDSGHMFAIYGPMREILQFATPVSFQNLATCSRYFIFGTMPVWLVEFINNHVYSLSFDVVL